MSDKFCQLNFFKRHAQQSAKMREIVDGCRREMAFILRFEAAFYFQAFESTTLARPGDERTDRCAFLCKAFLKEGRGARSLSQDLEPDRPTLATTTY